MLHRQGFVRLTDFKFGLPCANAEVASGQGILSHIAIVVYTVQYASRASSLWSICGHFLPDRM